MPARPALPRRAALALLPALAACGTTPVPPLAQGPRGRVVVLRGLLNIFSTGMTQLTLKLREAGYDATVHNHAEWRGLADRAAAAALAGTLPRPLAVAGHSFGADDAIQLAGRLGAAGVPVDLLVTFDPAWVLAVPRGPRRVLNFHQDRDTFARRLAPGPGFDGVIENRLVEDESHLSIDKKADLHRMTLAALEETRGAVAVAAAGAPPRAGVAATPASGAGMPGASGSEIRRDADAQTARASGATFPRASGATPLPRPPVPPVRAGR
jgi:alpha/beta superfamily hydrolase